MSDPLAPALSSFRQAGADLAGGYLPIPGRFDELKAPDGSLLPQWRALVAELAACEPGEFARRLATARRAIRENGVTYNVYDDAGGQARPWELDLVPFVLSAADWAAIEAGILQRARLAQALAADIYGPQRLIGANFLPPHLVLGHPQFLRPLLGVTPPGGVHIHLYAADIGRMPSGEWVVLSERADAPAGAGYVLENRIVVNQTFSDFFRDCGVRRLAAFYQACREGVLSLSPEERPRAVLLTPGPYNEAYFEHSYLARYLGLTLVEGEDLLVRDGGVFLKTLAGLERIDVIFRRVDSDFVDPLEFRSDSALGVPGLAEAARAGRVVIANALGSNVVESPALGAFLPALCRTLLGEELRLHSQPTLWCGTAEGRAAALADIDRYVFRLAFDNRPLFARGSTARIGAEMNRGERAELADLLARRGATMTAQAFQPLATAPVFEEGRLLPRPVSLRVFAAWTPNGYVVMPGGLTRVARDRDVHALSMQAGVASKDTWVLAEGPVDGFSLLAARRAPLPVRRLGIEAPSRAMDNLFWLGRYAERAEDMVRMLRAVLRRLGDSSTLDEAALAAALARRLLVPLAKASDAAASAAAEGDISRLTQELQQITFERDRPFGLQRILRNVQRTGWVVRDRLSLDTWRVVHAFASGEGLPQGALDGGSDPAETLAYLDGLIRRAAALAGLTAENMSRGRNRLFLDLGRRVERAANQAWLIRQILALAEEPESEQLLFLLEIADSTMTYRYRYVDQLQVAPVIDLLVLDDSNPRAIALQLDTLARHVADLPRATPAQARGQEAKLVEGVRARLKAADVEALAAVDDSGRRGELVALMSAVYDAMPQLADSVTANFFRHSTRRRAGFAPRLETA